VTIVRIYPVDATPGSGVATSLGEALCGRLPFAPCFGVA